ncbi:hypothetical protein [Oenococcus oeni]|uniref:hypothetical protein n=2 Tax=Oenococcus oeni TaxID=1247 RepID=UPI00065D922B|nr:hypothetical protein [Oenococcus oeni]KMQ39094.1 hypothetical protein AAX20_01970 [Oenococcus oeni]OIK89703.1 hypothetical protein ATW80_00755 [Oenococcus oeni]OIL88554.1 hypothetical protein ATX40_00785 [Oenococcus oeni]OIM72651.1 hypothetical protein ATX91_00640 [Oenococcus oeni]OLQ32408.1 hypothetical protein ATW77_00725 [Oenococcus oeni]
MITNEELVALKMRDLVNATRDTNRNSYYQMRYDDLLKFCGLDEKELLRVLNKFSKNGKLNFHGYIDEHGRSIHDRYIKNIFKVARPNNPEKTGTIWNQVFNNRRY